MESLLNEVSPPPSWSASFHEYFASLKEWIEQSAYPALIGGPLKADATVTSIPTELARIASEIALARPIPIAVVGRVDFPRFDGHSDKPVEDGLGGIPCQPNDNSTRENTR